MLIECCDRDFRRGKMWNPSLKSHIAEAMSSASCCASTGRLLGNVTEMLAAASESTSAPFTNCRSADVEGLNIQCRQPPGDVFPPAVPRVTVSACSCVGREDTGLTGALV
ncbi:uncharacterized protein ACIBXB_021573 [Morphnus guianensis]